MRGLMLVPSQLLLSKFDYLLKIASLPWKLLEKIEFLTFSKQHFVKKNCENVLDYFEFFSPFFKITYINLHIQNVQ